MTRTRSISVLFPAVPALVALLPLLALLPVVPVRAQWTQALPPMSPKIFALATLGGKVFAGFEIGVFRSSDQGANWTEADSGIDGFSAIFSFATDGSSLYAGTVGGGVFRTTDLGESWTAVGLHGEYISALGASEGRIYAGTCCSGLWISADGGATWRKAGIDSGYVSAVHAQGGTVYAGTSSGYFRSSDYGGTWARLHIAPGAGDSASGAFTVSGGALYASTRGGLYRSLDAGDHWTPAGFAGSAISGLTADSRGLFAAQWQGLYFSADSGANWLRVDSGLTHSGIFCLTLNDGEVFAGVSSRGVWRRPVAEMATTALGDRFRKAAGRRRAAQAFPYGSGIGFMNGGPEAASELRDAGGRASPQSR